MSQEHGSCSALSSVTTPLHGSEGVFSFLRYTGNMKPFDTLAEEKGFGFLKELLERFPHSDVYYVGGSVRDAALGRRVKDFDIVVRGILAKDLARFLEKHGHVEFVGEHFGVYKFKPEHDGLDIPIDIALPRTEKAGGSGAYKDFDVQSDHDLPIEDDLARRDFTMNAMAWNVRTRELVDPFGGMADLEAKRIRAVGEPKERFAEDYSRMFRALRFAAQLGASVEEKTWSAILESMPTFDASVVPEEVVAKELLKGLRADAERTLELWDVSGALKRLLPELASWDGKALGRLQKNKASMESLLAVMLYPVGSRVAGDMIRRMKLTTGGFEVTAERVMWLIDHYEYLYKHAPSDLAPSKLQKLLFDRKYRRKDLFDVTEAITESPSVQAWRDVKELKPLLSGEEVMKALNLDSGPKVGRILDHLMDLQGHGKLSHSAKAEAYLKEKMRVHAFPDSLQ